MSLWEVAMDAGTVAGGIAYADLISDRGQQYADDMGKLAGVLQNDAKFKGYGVKTGLANTTVRPDGSMNLGIGRNNDMNTAGHGAAIHSANAMSNAMGMIPGSNNMQNAAMRNMANAGVGLPAQQGASFGAANMFRGQSMQDTGAREQDIYNRAMAMQQPGLDAQRAQSNAMEYAQGRGGVMGSQFGGTGEDQAMARAQAQAQNAASFQAMGQAQAEQLQQANLANMYGQQGLANAGMSSNIGQAYNQMGLGNMAQQTQAAATLGQLGYQKGNLGLAMQEASYLPMQNQLQALQVGQNNANLAQTGQLTGTGYGAQLGLGGIQTAVNADKASSELYGNMFGAMMSSDDGDGGLFDRIRNWF